MLKDFDVSIRLGLDYASAYVNRALQKEAYEITRVPSRIVIPRFAWIQKMLKLILTEEMQTRIGKP